MPKRPRNKEPATDLPVPFVLNGARIMRVKLSDIHKSGHNPRVMSDTKRDSLKKSIRKFGLVEPIVWNEKTGNIIGGHQRYDVLIEAGETETDVVVMNVSREDEQALNLALNQIHGEWDIPKLKEVLRELSKTDIDLLLSGFDGIELASFLQIPDFGPVDEYEQPRLDERSKVTCPNCGHEFTP